MLNLKTNGRYLKNCTFQSRFIICIMEICKYFIFKQFLQIKDKGIRIKRCIRLINLKSKLEGPYFSISSMEEKLLVQFRIFIQLEKQGARIYTQSTYKDLTSLTKFRSIVTLFFPQSEGDKAHERQASKNSYFIYSSKPISIGLGYHSSTSFKAVLINIQDNPCEVFAFYICYDDWYSMVRQLQQRDMSFDNLKFLCPSLELGQMRLDN